jgi:cytidine diphosphoramidate kinase
VKKKKTPEKKTPKKMPSGHVIWITGLPGAGKSTIAKSVFQKAKTKAKVILDGDQLREILGFESDHSLESRKMLASRYGKLSKALSEQGLLVICATVSMFDSVRDWNRKNIKNYIEVYLNVPMNTLIQRDQKNLYSKALKGEIQNVQGINAEFEAPKKPDLQFENKNSKDVLLITKKILEKVSKKKR